MSFHTKPFAHQIKSFNAHADKEAWGHLWEQGCGKSWIGINTTRKAFDEKRINGAVVIAPNGVHANWAHEELPRHWPLAGSKFVWHSQKSGTKKHKFEFDKFLRSKGCAWFCISFDAVKTKAGNQALMSFLKSRKCIVHIDESTKIKNPTSQITLTIVGGKYKRKVYEGIGKYAVMRRIYTGTPVANSPVDVWSQINFLDPSFWKTKGFPTFFSFRATFCKTHQIVVNRQSVTIITGYQNLDKLATLVADITDRYLKIDCFDLPPKIYSTAFFDLSKEHQKVYDALAFENTVELEGKDQVSVTEQMSLATKLQQVTSGFIKATDDSDQLVVLPGPNNRLERLRELITEQYTKPCIIWCRYRQEIAQVAELLRELKLPFAEYHGGVSVEDREKCKLDFRNASIDYIVANTATMGKGVTLLRAEHLIYYSNTLNLEDRMQSEDRAHRAGLEHSIDIIDMCANQTLDEKWIIPLLRAKQDVCRQAIGDQIKEWI